MGRLAHAGPQSAGGPAGARGAGAARHPRRRAAVGRDRHQARRSQLRGVRRHLPLQPRAGAVPRLWVRRRRAGMVVHPGPGHPAVRVFGCPPHRPAGTGPGSAVWALAARRLPVHRRGRAVLQGEHLRQHDERRVRRARRCRLLPGAGRARRVRDVRRRRARAHAAGAVRGSAERRHRRQERHQRLCSEGAAISPTTRRSPRDSSSG